jgi:phospholipase C
MTRTAFLSLSLLLLGAGGLLLSLNGCGGGSATFTQPPPPTNSIQHIVIIFQENRTPDNLFQDPVLIARGADIKSSGVNSLKQTIPLAQSELGIDYDLSHKHDAFVAMCDQTGPNQCAMDGADLIPYFCTKGATDCPPANPQFMYVNPAEVAPYFQMAEQYTFADRTFQTNQGPSFPAHQFIISGTSAPSVGSNLFAAENPLGIPTSSADAGCTAPSDEFVSLIDPSGDETTNPTMFPCFEHPTLTDELTTKGVSWRYYAPIPGSIWTAPNAIQHMCVPQPDTNGVLHCTGSDWTGTRPNVVFPETTVLTDIASGQLPQVSWVIPTGSNSDHAGDPTTTGGPSWVASIVNAIGNSSYWSNTAIIILWDDWGGWYDHVSPPKLVNDGTSWGSGYVYGFRVPMIVVSPYAKPAHISKVQHDFGSILKFIEETFKVPSLGLADVPADDLSDCFDLSQTPIKFKTIDAPLKAADFLNDKRPRTGPDDD